MEKYNVKTRCDKTGFLSGGRCDYVFEYEVDKNDKYKTVDLLKSFFNVHYINGTHKDSGNVSVRSFDGLSNSDLDKILESSEIKKI